MENINEIQENISINNSVIAYIVIDHGYGVFTSMAKTSYDAMQAEQSTPMVTDEAASL
jgi:hypothetical protein